MQVSFNGINNIRIFKKEYAKYGAYVTQDNKVKQGDKHYTVVKISCNLPSLSSDKLQLIFTTV